MLILFKNNLQPSTSTLSFPPTVYRLKLHFLIKRKLMINHNVDWSDLLSSYQNILYQSHFKLGWNKKNTKFNSWTEIFCRKYPYDLSLSRVIDLKVFLNINVYKCRFYVLVIDIHQFSHFRAVSEQFQQLSWQKLSDFCVFKRSKKSKIFSYKLKKNCPTN